MTISILKLNIKERILNIEWIKVILIMGIISDKTIILSASCFKKKFRANLRHFLLKINIISSDKVYFDEIAKVITTSSNVNSLYIEHNKLINSDNEDIEEE